MRSSMKKGFAKPRASLLKLAKQQKFDDIIRVLTDDGYDVESWMYDASEKNGALSLFRGETPLHIVMEHRPPVEVVSLLIRRMTAYNPSIIPEEATDMQGRNPLHIAAASGCAIKVVSRLLNGVSAIMPAVSKDSLGRYPLHWACAKPLGAWRTGRRSTGSSSKQAIENMILVVVALVKAYPEAVTVMDADGFTPLALARKNHADERMLDLLERQVKRLCPAPDTAATNTETRESSEHECDLGGIPRAIFELFEDDRPNADLSSVGTGGVSVVVSKNDIKDMPSDHRKASLPKDACDQGLDSKPDARLEL